MDFYLTTSASTFSCFQINWYDSIYRMYKTVDNFEIAFNLARGLEE